MKTITVISYKFGEKTWENFEGEPIKKYEHSVLLDISNTEVFSDKEKAELNYKIVVPFSRIREKRFIKDIPLSNVNEALNKKKASRRK
jgi:Trm5-related predicted tRNA methylase